ncbi:MAG: metallophosphoesterase [archaeon]|nr:metallophosphoesterase [archaeon]
MKVDTKLNAALYANRALIELKLDYNVLALSDACEALFWDSSNIKAHFRKANANLNLKRLNEALKDFSYLVSKAEDDGPYVSKKIEETKKLIESQKQLLSNKEDINAKLFFNSSKLNLSSIQEEIKNTEIDTDYDGPHLSEPLSIDWIKLHIIEKMKRNIYIHKKYLLQLIYKVIQLNMALPSLVEINVPEDINLTICGDIHGQFYDLLTIFDKNGFPSETKPYLFTGDFVDRGSFGIEVIITLMFLKILYPNHFFMSRGNHENRAINKIYGFENEVKEKYDNEVYEAFIQLFHSLPLAHLVNNKILALHGGLFSRDGVTLQEIKEIDRFGEVPDTGLMCELLWSDPIKMNGRYPNKRGVAITFGPDIANQFLDDNKLDLLIRSHEMKMNGYEVEGRVITVFSAPNYCDQMGNIGAYMIIKGSDLSYEFIQFREVSHPRAPNYTGTWMFL